MPNCIVVVSAFSKLSEILASLIFKQDKREHEKGLLEIGVQVKYFWGMIPVKLERDIS